MSKAKQKAHTGICVLQTSLATTPNTNVMTVYQVSQDSINRSPGLHLLTKYTYIPPCNILSIGSY